MQWTVIPDTRVTRNMFSIPIIPFFLEQAKRLALNAANCLLFTKGELRAAKITGRRLMRSDWSPEGASCCSIEPGQLESDDHPTPPWSTGKYSGVPLFQPTARLHFFFQWRWQKCNILAMIFWFHRLNYTILFPYTFSLLLNGFYWLVVSLNSMLCKKQQFQVRGNCHIQRVSNSPPSLLGRFLKIGKLYFDLRRPIAARRTLLQAAVEPPSNVALWSRPQPKPS